MSIKDDFPQLHLQPLLVLWQIEGSRPLQRSSLLLPKETLVASVERLLPELVVLGGLSSQALLSKKPVTERFQVFVSSSKEPLPWDSPIAVLRLPPASKLLLRPLEPPSSSTTPV